MQSPAQLERLQKRLFRKKAGRERREWATGTTERPQDGALDATHPCLAAMARVGSFRRLAR